MNGGRTNSFNPSRGLRQGDPLFPYLFILCRKVLYRLIDRELMNGNFSGIKMNRGGPEISHVMYTDDIMLFSKASSKEVKALNGCLEKYCNWLGQLINQNKSRLIFSKVVPKEKQRVLKRLLQMKTLSKDASYLGAPLFTIRNKFKDFKFLHEKLEGRLLGWRSKCLS